MLTGLQGKRTSAKTAPEAFHVLSSLPLLNDESHSRNRQPPVPSHDCTDLHLGVCQRRCLERDLPSSVNLRSGLRRLKLAWPDHLCRVLIYTSKPDVKCDSNYAGKQILPNNISYHGPQDHSGGRHPC